MIKEKTHKRPRDTSNKRNIAKALGLDWYFTGIPCSYGHVDKRYMSGAQCFTCLSERGCANTKNEKERFNSVCGLSAKTYRKHLQQVREEQFPCSQDEALSLNLSFFFTGEPCRNGHTDARRTRTKECATCNYDTLNKAREKWLEADPSRKVRDRKEQQKQYYIENFDAIVAKASKRRADRDQRTPKWLTPFQKKQIELIYTVRSLLTKQTGEEYHVDHIVPLRGKTVCGLHVPWNLRPLKASENLSRARVWDAESNSENKDGLR